jgi:hypothetical protein
MTKTQALLYKQRWNRVQQAQNLELQKSSMPLKFKQLCFLMNSFRTIPTDKIREKETNQIRQRWLLLKKKQPRNGHK